MSDIRSDRILIIDFGAQYTQLIARRVRELGVYCEIYAFDASDAAVREFAPKGIILSGGPESVTVDGGPRAPQAAADLARIFHPDADIPLESAGGDHPLIQLAK